MPVIFDTGALAGPEFTAADFTATKWVTGQDKAKFANNLCRFVAADFKTTMFTEKMYPRLAMNIRAYCSQQSPRIFCRGLR